MVYLISYSWRETMDFELNERQKAFKKKLVEYLKQELAPLVEEIEAAHEFPMSFYKKMAENNLIGINYPKKYGGSDADCITGAILIEELSKYSSSVAGSVTTAGMTSAYPILVSGTKAQREKYLYGVPSGETITAFAITEPDAGSDLRHLSTHAVRDGDFYRINGTKIFTTNGSVATVFLIVAATDEEGKEFTVFIIDKGTAGLKVSKKFDKLGWAAQDTTELSLSDVMVPKEDIIGKEGAGMAKAFESIAYTRILMGATALGVAESALKHASDYAQSKRRSGKAIIKNQWIRTEFARMATEIEMSRLLVYQAAWMQDKGIRNRKEAAMAKYYSTEIAKRISRETLRIFGTEGFSTSHQSAIFFSDTPVFTVADGTSEIQKENIARELGYLKSGEMGK
jgi:alkylation response protein AidB-like acyl-CoA dehydrogenase